MPQEIRFRIVRPIAMALMTLTLFCSALGLQQPPQAAAQEPLEGVGGAAKAQAKAVKLQIPIVDVEAIDVLKVEEELRTQLLQKAGAYYNQEPLENVVKIMSEQCNLPILIDRQALEEIGLTTDVPVTLRVKQATARSILRLALQPLKLTYVIKDEVIQITTQDAGEEIQAVRVYGLSPRMQAQANAVMSTIEAMASPSTWEAVGGPSKLCQIENVIVVSATEDIHQEVEQLLQKIGAKWNPPQAQPAKQK